MVELLQLQEENLIPSEVTAEDMIDLLFEKSKSTVKERRVTKTLYLNSAHVWPIGL